MLDFYCTSNTVTQSGILNIGWISNHFSKLKEVLKGAAKQEAQTIWSKASNLIHPMDFTNSPKLSYTFTAAGTIAGAYLGYEAADFIVQQYNISGWHATMVHGSGIVIGGGAGAAVCVWGGPVPCAGVIVVGLGVGALRYFSEEDCTKHQDANDQLKCVKKKMSAQDYEIVEDQFKTNYEKMKQDFMAKHRQECKKDKDELKTNLKESKDKEIAALELRLKISINENSDLNKKLAELKSEADYYVRQYQELKLSEDLVQQKYDECMERLHDMEQQEGVTILQYDNDGHIISTTIFPHSDMNLHNQSYDHVSA